jgi:hypothetical protein
MHAEAFLRKAPSTCTNFLSLYSANNKYSNPILINLGEVDVEMSETSKKIGVGLTSRSFLALIYVVVVFQPASIWLYLMTGSVTLYSAIQWATLLLFVELARLSGKPLTKEEATIIFLGAWLAGQFGLFLGGFGASVPGAGWIYQAWFKNSPIARVFNLDQYIPHFYAPLSSEPVIFRTFFNPAWVPVAIASFSFITTAAATDISLGLLARQIYVEIENLPFPLTQPVVDAVISMTERKLDGLRVISIFALVGLAHGALTYAIPVVLQTWGIPFSPIPIPWADFNKFFHPFIPGISLGLGTDLIILTTGFIVPFYVCLAIFIGSFAIYGIGNIILVTQRATIFGQTWTEGMSVADSWQRSMMYAWSGPLIGLAVAVGVLPLIRRPEVLVGLSQLLRGKKKVKVRIPLHIMLVPWLISTVGLSIVDYVFAPDMPIWFFLLINVFWSFSYILINGRAAGVAMPISIPYVRELAIIASGYGGYNAWFVPMHVYPGDWCSMYKICDLTETHPLSFAKAMALVWPIALFFGFLYTQNFWRIAPIPSASYPGVNVYWPITATLQALLISRPAGVFEPLTVIYGFIVSIVIFLGLDFIMPTISAPITMGIMVGSFTPIPNALAILLGAIIGKIISFYLGKSWWNKYRALCVAGISLGEGLIIVVGIAISLIIKSTWLLEY